MDKELILREIKLHLGIKKEVDFAKFLGIKPQTLNTWYSRNTFDFEILYAKCVDINPHWLLTGEGNMLKSEKIPVNTIIEPIQLIIGGDNNRIPLMPKKAFASFNDESVQIFNNDVETYLSLPMLREKADFAWEISGDSMDGTYDNGGIVVCKKINTDEFRWEKSYLIGVDNSPMVKRIYPSTNPNNIICRSDNRKYSEFEVRKKDVTSLAKILAYVRIDE